MAFLRLDGNSLSIESLLKVINNKTPIELSPESIESVKKASEWIKSNHIIHIWLNYLFLIQMNF